MIHQAIFGDVNGAHDLIIASRGAPNAVLADLTSRYTDRILPAEVPWEPYLCGYPLHDYFILTRTFSVPASRPGMVQTHALILPLEGFSNYPFLIRALQYLPNQVVEPASVSVILFDTLGVGDVPFVPQGYASVVRALLSGRTPVWIGHDGFEEVVSYLWYRLWPDTRRDLRFRISSGPNDLGEWPTTIAYSPVTLRMQWGERFLVDQKTRQIPDPTPIEAYLIGLPEGKALGQARERLELTTIPLSSLKRLEQYTARLSSNTTSDIRAAARLLGAIAPDPLQAKQEKKAVLTRLKELTVTGTEDDILGLRNFSPTPFEQATVFLEESMKGWISNCIERGHGGLSVAEEAFLVERPWRSVAIPSILSAFSPWRRNNAVLLWQWWQEQPELIESLFSVVPMDESGETDLIDTMPLKNVGNTMMETLLSSAQERSWYRFHAALLAVSELAIPEKFRRQIRLDADTKNLAAIEPLASRVEGRDLLLAAIDIGDERLLRLAGKSVAEAPDLMNNIDVSQVTWRAVWVYSLDHGAEVLAGIQDPLAVIYQVMDQVTAGVDIPLILLEKLSPRLDLSEYPRRPEVWALLPATVTNVAQITTAKSWLRRFLIDPEFQPPLEQELKSAVLAEWRSNSFGSPEAIIRLMKMFPELTEADFLRWLQDESVSVSPTISTSIGRLVRERQWLDAVKEMIQQARNERTDLTYALKECSNMLGLWDRVKIALLGASGLLDEQEWWAEWVNLSAELYPVGIYDNNIWEEASGDCSRVRGDTGREQWSHALHLLQKGGGGETITAEGLLHQMRNDFPNNERLKDIEDIYKRWFSTK